MGVVEPKNPIEFFSLVSLKGRLQLELKGMTSSKPPTAYSQLKKMGYKGDRERVLEQVSQDVEEAINAARESHRVHYQTGDEAIQDALETRTARRDRS